MTVRLGRRQRHAIDYTLTKHVRGYAPSSINEVAQDGASQPWHINSNSEAIRVLIQRGLLTTDADHPDAHPQGRGAVLLTEAGVRAALEHGLATEPEADVVRRYLGVVV